MGQLGWLFPLLVNALELKIPHPILIRFMDAPFLTGDFFSFKGMFGFKNKLLMRLDRIFDKVVPRLRGRVIKLDCSGLAGLISRPLKKSR
jgi:hypothetical protein